MSPTIIMRPCFRRSGLQKAFSHQPALRLNRTYATGPKPGQHPSDSIPVKGALPVSNRFLRNFYIFAGGMAIGGFYAYRKLETSVDAAIEPSWSAFTLESKDPVSPTAAIFTLRSKSLKPLTYEDLWQRAIWAVDLQQPQLQIVREYTPLPPAIDADGKLMNVDDAAKLHLLIREEYKGEVSGYLHRLPIGADVQVSKPYSQIDLQRENPDRLVFIVGGTGITTALQAIHALLETKRDSSKKPSIHVLWANRKREDCLGGINDTPAASQSGSWWTSIASAFGFGSSTPAITVQATELGKSPLVDELRRLKHTYHGHLKVDYFVDEEGSRIQAEDVEKALVTTTGPDEKTFIAISGPDGFMTNLAGEKRSLKNQVSDRPESGMLAELKSKGWRLMILG